MSTRASVSIVEGDAEPMHHSRGTRGWTLVPRDNERTLSLVRVHSDDRDQSSVRSLGWSAACESSAWISRLPRERSDERLRLTYAHAASYTGWSIAYLRNLVSGAHPGGRAVRS